ncbi:MAG: polysaccharide deacetylase family protein [Bryobacteraceae bacterium]
MKRRRLTALCAPFVLALAADEPRSEIMKWQDGKKACVSLTYDDSSINQFRIALPLMNERGLPGTFFIITGGLPGSRNKATFAGRPIMEILRESETIPTTRDNVLERSSAVWYLRDVQRLEELRDYNVQRAGRMITQGNFEAVNAALAKLRQTGTEYTVRERQRNPESGSRLTWDEFRKYAAQGHEFASHTVSHPFMPALDEANILYEAEKSTEDIREQLGPKHTFSIECPYGIHDERVGRHVIPKFPLTRNWVTDDFMDGIMRGDSRNPKESKKEYVQWQRGPLARTTLEQMKEWIDTSLDHGIWLVLVIHGVEGIGWEAQPTERIRAYFDYIKEREPRLWVATFQDGAKYARERMKSTVVTKQAGGALEVNVTHSLDPKLYDVPLTVRTPAPSNWKAARFRQGRDSRAIPVHRDGNGAYVMYRVAPNAGVARLSPESP